MPTPTELLNTRIRDAAGGLPRRGGYEWPTPDKTAGGCTIDLTIDGQAVLRAGKPRPGMKSPPTYCCGITLEIFWRGWKRLAADYGLPFMGGLGLADAKQLQRAWFCVDTRKGALDALVPLGLGVEVAANDARPGDFAQLWRRSGSGHSVMVLGIAGGRISYFSTQKSTQGIGSTTEPLPDETYIVRPVVP
jgi:hypothetical protein